MRTEAVPVRGTTMAIACVGEDRPDACNLVWGHGWGQSGSALAPLAESLGRTAFSFLIDFPGFGGSPLPPGPWGTADYADAVADWLDSLPPRKRIWIGHSFGCRVGIQLASRRPDLVAGMVLISAAGLPRRRSFTNRIAFAGRKWGYKIAKVFVPEGPRRDRLRAKFGSADYKAAGPMRAILNGVVREDLSRAASTVVCPTLLIFGAEDRDTPPEMGSRYRNLISRSELVVLDGFDHTNILDKGRHQVVHLINRFTRDLAQ